MIQTRGSEEAGSITKSGYEQSHNTSAISKEGNPRLLEHIQLVVLVINRLFLVVMRI